MKNLIIFLPILILVLLETTIVPLNLTLIAVILWAALCSARQGLTVAFLAGLILDLFMGKSWGWSSLAFLISVLPVYFYKNRFQAERWQFLLPYSLSATIIFNLFFGSVSLPSLIFVSILVVLFLPIFKFLSQINEDNNQLKLSV